MSNIYTTDDYTKKKEEERKQEQRTNLLTTASAAGIGVSGVYIGNQMEGTRELFSSLPGANRYSKKHDISVQEAVSQNFKPINVRNLYKDQTIGRSLNSIIASTEELSPANVLKTLQLSNFIEPFVDIGAEQSKSPIHIPSTAVESFQDFYNAQIVKQSNGKKRLHPVDIDRGFMLLDGTLYSIKPDGSIDYVDPVLKNVKLATTNVKIGEHYSPNRVLEKYANMLGVELDRKAYPANSIVAVSSNSKLGLIKEWTQAFGRYSMEIGYKSMDNPLAGVEELLSITGIENTNLVNNPTYNKIKSKMNINLGTGGDYTLDTLSSLKAMTKNLVTKSLVGYLGYQGINSVLGALTPESSVWHEGLLSGLAATYANTRVNLAKVIADPFQSYKEAQEEAAPDSTNLTTLIGLPLAGAFAGASYEYYKRLYKSGATSIEKASSEAAKEVGYSFLDKPLKQVGFRDVTPMKSKAVIGGVIGGSLALPFLPGALIGKSSDQLRSEYSGETEVENRTNAGWLMGGGKFEGENVKNYQASWVARTVLNVKNEVRYGGEEGKRSLDPILHPFKYLSNPYRYEEMHTKDSPYPIWGMEVNYGSFLGKAFQGTVGEVIKPTVINDEFIAQMREATLQSQIDQEGNKYGSKTALFSTSYSIPAQIRPKERSLVEDGLMYAPESPISSPAALLQANTAATLGDFTGAKGFAFGLGVKALGFDIEDSGLQLARSGGATSASQDLKDENLGDLFGLGEFARRLVPHTASTAHDYANPMVNQISPNWMPHDSSRYYNNFQTGDYWSKVENGEARLAGVGFNLLHKELDGVNPDRYPLVYKYKILADTANASPEHLAMRDQLLELNAKGKLNDEEKDLFYITLEQEQVKSKKREFQEYKTKEEFSKLSLSQKVLNTLWEPVTHRSESVLEPLTPIRPGAKFIHARSAIEDYEKTQIQGPDTAIWTNPYSHFIKPAINRVNGLLPGTQMTSEAQERDEVDEYFDKIAYLKARREGNTNAALKTVIGSTFGGIYNTETMNKFRAGLTADQRMYVDAFASETDSKKRNKILEMLPSDVSTAYKSIWENLEVAEQAKKKGIDPEEALMKHYTEKTDKFVKAAGGTMDKYGTTPRNPDDKFEKERERRLRAADKVAEEYIASTTGVPSNDWIGWDPRLTAKDLKLRTLTVGKADIFRHGYWQSDVDRNERIMALDDTKEVIGDYNKIRRNLREERNMKQRIENSLFEQGFQTRRIELSSASRNDIVIRDKQE